MSLLYVGYIKDLDPLPLYDFTERPNIDIFLIGSLKKGVYFLPFQDQ
jgi:hypothetical protein